MPTLDQAARQATRAIRENVPRKAITDALPSSVAEEAYAVARLRKDAAERFRDPWELWFDEEGLRYATPDLVAEARAARLADHGDTVADVACGVGVQLAYLGLALDAAVGIERDEDRVALARRNANALGSKATVVHGDALDAAVRDQVGAVELVVCDPARDPEAPKRVFADLSPDLEAVHRLWSQGATAWCYELPPMMPPERVASVFDGECEYTSLDGELNRLALWGGEAADAARAALSLPAGERLTDLDDAAPVERTDQVGSFVHLVDRAVLSADLLDRLVERSDGALLLADDHPRRTLLTSGSRTRTAFTEDYAVIETAPWDLEGVRRRLDAHGCGKVTLRMRIEPAAYWDVRNALEKGLEGELHVHLFRVGERAVLARPLT